MVVLPRFAQLLVSGRFSVRAVVRVRVRVRYRDKNEFHPY